MVTNKEIHTKLNELRKQLKNIKELEEATKKEYDDVCKNCFHEYILVYDKGKQFMGGDVSKCYCLICDKKFTYNGYDFRDIKDIYVIDITKEFRQYDILDLFLDDRYGNNKKIEKAKNIFDKYFSEEYQNYNDETLKLMIKKDILENFGIKEEKIKTKNIYGEW